MKNNNRYSRLQSFAVKNKSHLFGIVSATTLVLGIAASANAAQITIDWKNIGGSNTFERQAVTFSPVNVSSFLGFSSGGHWENLVGTENSSISALIYLRVGGNWMQFAQDNLVRGPYGSTATLDNFTFLPIDFTSGALDGINITNSGAGASQYSGMTDNGSGTMFVFESTPVPIPAAFWLFGSGLLGLFGIAKRRPEPRSSS